MTHQVRIKRIYDDAAAGDGARVLVDRVWPRGIRKADAQLTVWDRDIAPSTELRKWYGHDPAKFEEFAERYRAELAAEPAAAAVAKLRNLQREGPVTLLTATAAVDISQAAVLRELLAGGQEPGG